MARASAGRSLRTYRRKRDFARTPEPAGGRTRRSSGRSFVVQRHQARRLHYDFRLEWGGTLKSWAVPKGPSLDPGVKRLAVEVEDHPLEYRDFSGTIPHGEYGAGSVEIWDRGTWTADGDVAAGLRDGHLDFALHGRRLKGGWSLIRLKGDERRPNWLLIKRRDAHATQGGAEITETARAPLPRRRTRRTEPDFVAPQLATAVEAAPRGGHWLSELKLDGYRLMAHVDGARVRCFSRNGHDWSHRFGEIRAALAAVALEDCWLDGEVVATDEAGRTHFQRLQQQLDSADESGLVLFVFDLLFLAGADLRDEPLLERKRLLHQTLAPLAGNGRVRLLDYVDSAIGPLYEEICRQQFEGMLVKDATAPYRSGRNRAWLKLKCRQEDEFVVGGYTRTEQGRGTLTALLLGQYDGKRLRFAGRAGTGFTNGQLTLLRRRLDALARATTPFDPAPALRSGERPTWVRPELVAQVRYAGWTDAGLLRQPLFLGVREDLAPSEVRAAKTVASAARRGRVAASATRRKSAPARRSRDSVVLTHPQRVVFPDDGITKQQLADYYAALADALWPHLERRPLSILRSVDGDRFFQRHLADETLPGLKSAGVGDDPERGYFYCASRRGLASLAQIGAVELHTWGARLPRPARADRLTFDLDPDPALEWRRVREAAVLTRDLLAELGLASRLKTSGGHGLHVVVPLTGRLPEFERAAAFARAVARHLARTIPDRFSARRGAENRKGKIYVDWQRNQVAATTVAAYSPRWRAGAPVSMPVAWSEVGERDLRGTRFNLRSAPAHFLQQGDPWQREPPIHQTLTMKIIRRLDDSA